MAYHFNFTDECNDLHLLWYLYLVIYSSLLLNAICNYLLFFTTFTFISHCKIVKQTNLFSPFYWFAGIFRILCIAFSRGNILPTLIEKIFYIFKPLWYAGCLPGTFLPELVIKKFPYYISYETIIKLFISFSAFIFSSYAAIQKYRKGRAKK